MLLPRDEGVPGLRGDTLLIGWHDEEAIYLMPEASFKEVARFCRESGEPFPVRETRLKRDLSRENISECDPGRYTITVKVGGRAQRVLRLRRLAVDSLLGVDFEVPSPLVTTVTTFER